MTSERTEVVVFLIILSIFALAIAALSQVQVRSLRRRFSDALGGQDGQSLESTLVSHLEQVKQVDTRLGELEAEYKRLSITGSLASQKISIVRFNPFGDTGGDQSFSLAVLDAQDSGYVLTSIHGRQGTRVYVKPVDLGTSKYTLSAEEQKALSQAIKRVPNFDE
jgi:Protein of unknown function (DUF4446)